MQKDKLMKNIKKILHVIEIAILILSVSAVISMAVTYPKSTIFGIRPFVIASGSMIPVFEIGDIVFARPVSNPDELNIGDIAAYKKNLFGLGKTSIIIHRIIDITENGYVFKGDNNEIQDDVIIKYDEILYKIIQ